MYNIFIVGVGGFLGAISRYLLSTGTQGLFPLSRFPWGTLSVNVLGSLLIGFIMGFFESKAIFTFELRLLFISGFLGAFTTFSTFSLETFTLFKDGNGSLAILNILLQLGLGLSTVWMAYLLGKNI